MTTTRRRRGFTLLEMTVYSAVAMLAITSIYSVLLTGLHFFSTTSNSAELQQDAMKILGRLTRELSESDSQTVQLSSSPSPQGISFASPRDLLGNVRYSNGTLQWQSFICYYVAPAAPFTLMRKQISIAATAPVNPNVTNQLPTYTVTKFITIAGAATELLDTNVTTFSGARTGRSMSITLKLDKRDPSGTILLSPGGTTLDEIFITTSGVLMRN